MTELIEKLSAYGEVHLCRAGAVFSVLVVGPQCGNIDINLEMQKVILGATKEYPNIEAMSIQDSHFCLILTKEVKPLPARIELRVLAEQISLQKSIELKATILAKFLEQKGNY